MLVYYVYNHLYSNVMNYKRRITQLRMVRQFHRDPASLPLATFLLQFLILGLNHVANIHDLLSVELHILKEF